MGVTSKVVVKNEENPITYKDLLDALKELTDEQLKMSACIYFSDSKECLDVYETTLSDLVDVDDVVGENQPLLVIKA